MKDWMQERFEELTGKFKHFCLEHDDLPIDETCPEIINCLCFMAEDIKEVKKMMEKKRDEDV